MERSNWGQKSGQEYTLAVRITRQGWEEALSLAVLTTPELSVYGGFEDWKRQFDRALVHVQWDTERSFRGVALSYYSIQVGLSRHIIRRYVEEWIVGIEDYSPLVSKISALLKAGKSKEAKRLLPKERVYPLEDAIGRRILVS